MNPRTESALAKLVAGNERFRSGAPAGRTYAPDDFAAFARGQSPTAAIVTCADSRVAPEVIFDQPLGSFLVARVPGNVASESVRWMLDIAVGELNVGLVLVVGHTGCRAIEQVIENKPSARHAVLQTGIHSAIARVGGAAGPQGFRAVVAENARQTVRDLLRDVPDLQRAASAGITAIVPAVYDVADGSVELLIES